MLDSYGRKIDYMRISVTDRCNLRCKYCMPHDIDALSHEGILRFEEILTLCRYALELGISKFKVTGGEPFARKGLMPFLHKLKALPGVEQLTLTSNGVLLAPYLQELRDIGIDGINISLDTLRPERFKQMTGSDDFIQLKENICKAQSLSLRTKINAVLIKGFNEDEFFDLLQLAKDYPLDVRFIELMPLGYGKNYEGLSKDRLLQKLQLMYPVHTPVQEKRGNGPASYIRIPDFQGCIGFIDAIHGKFCHACNRIRLTSDGLLKSCLYYESSVDLKKLLRARASKQDILAQMRKSIIGKPSEHLFCETVADPQKEERKMSQIGG